jgi:hypothetical protein
MKLRNQLLTVAAAFLVSAAISVAQKIEDFKPGEIDAVWKVLWQQSSNPAVKMPAIEKLSEKDVLDHMLGKWTKVQDANDLPDHGQILLGDKHRVEYLCKDKNGKPKKNPGQWRVISDKLVLFMQESSGFPDFIFLIGKTAYMFDPWGKMMKSELRREK